MISFIVGSGFYEFDGFGEVLRNTRWGEARFLEGSIGGESVLVLPRHGSAHQFLPHQINVRANLAALKEHGARAIVSCSVCGVVNRSWEVGRPMVASDLYFPDNRLGDGSCCTIFDQDGEPGRGHLLAGSLFDPKLSRAVGAALSERSAVSEGCYGHVLGPRFNSQSEIRALAAAGVDFISQTCGPEAVLANEMEIPFALAAFAVDFANGVREEATPVDVLRSNLERGRETFTRLIQKLGAGREDYPFENFVYRFE